MKKMVIRGLEKLIIFLQKQYNKTVPAKESKLNEIFTSLSPIDDADIENDYKKSLDWALKNRKEKNIKNIALAGPYGSGKSSIIRTYIKTYIGDDLHFLHISLATFKEEEVDGRETQYQNQAKKNNDNNDLLRLIELSILQQ